MANQMKIKSFFLITSILCFFGFIALRRFVWIESTTETQEDVLTVLFFGAIILLIAFIVSVIKDKRQY